MLRFAPIAALVALALCGTAAAQQLPLEGYFIALSECEANKKKTSDNPGNIRLEKMRAYAMIARNATPGTHYQITVPGAPVTESRWVAMSCGAYAPKSALVVPGSPPPPDNGSPPPPPGLTPDSIEAVLAASWEPAFCKSSAGQNKSECQTQTPDRFDATHFSLHGLWPDDLDDKQIFPCYCERGAPVRCGGSRPRDTSIALSADVMTELSAVMPGVQSGLHLHEWPKHGACYEDDDTGADTGADPDEYFSDAMELMDELNDSPVQQLFAENLGEILTRDQIEAALNEAFGAGAAERVIIKCNGSGPNAVISELWISLEGDITPAADLAGLILAAPTTATSTNDRSCASGRVVEVTAH